MKVRGNESEQRMVGILRLNEYGKARDSVREGVSERRSTKRKREYPPQACVPGGVIYIYEGPNHSRPWLKQQKRSQARPR